MVIDGHVHIFSPKIIANVSAKTEMVEKLALQTASAPGRTEFAVLKDECRQAGIDACLILPTAEAAEVRRVNASFVALAGQRDFLHAAGTLHPRYAANGEELLGLQAQGVRAIKLCSFSQGFSLAAPETARLLAQIEEVNLRGKGSFFVILDTFYLAHVYFGTPRHHTTTPALLGALVRKYPGIDFVGAHMGGLAAPPEEIFAHLIPAPNLYLDTSNAAHTLAASDFLRLLDLHGPEHILFGTDWPWFGHRAERDLIAQLLDQGGLRPEEMERVFYRNMADLLGLI